MPWRADLRGGTLSARGLRVQVGLAAGGWGGTEPVGGDGSSAAGGLGAGGVAGGGGAVRSGR